MNITETYQPKKGELYAKLITPKRMLLFWDTSETAKSIFELYFGMCFDKLVPIVRIYDVTDIQFNGKNAHHYYEIVVPYQHGYWFVKGLAANRSYVAELGIYQSVNQFFPLLRSNCIQTPSFEDISAVVNHDLIQLQKYEETTPKWTDFVSTYSYYGESKNMEGNHE
ncbi:DUF4912 domain-containing protein [Neobacillus sp. LXY-1]|uniref:DUF4912 domain-containing protein n=1 Tax=Neobacillus sp. LXY-1 TaxID=3379133 RepID=UPI003EE03B6A